MSMSSLPRPSFPLAPAGLGTSVDFTFPRLDDNLMIPTEANGGTGHFEWVLDFTNNGKTPGIVMSQSRMREIEAVINPFSVSVEGPGMGHLGQNESWVDLLVCSVLLMPRASTDKSGSVEQGWENVRILHSSLCTRS